MWKKGLHAALRLALTASIIATIAGVILYDRGGEVPEAEADIFWLNAGEETKHAKFVETIKEYGFSPPQTYDWNGIDMSVSMLQTDMSPREVMYDLQAEFVKSGVNGDMFARPPEPGNLGNPEAAAMDTFLAGQGAAEFVSGSMIPVADRADYAAMVGVDTKKNAQTYVDFLAEATEAETSDDIFNSTRYIEAFRDGSDRNTTVLAIWSDRELKLSQLTPDGAVHKNIPDLPACIGCSVTSQVAGRGEQSGFLAMTLDSGDTPEGAVEFYKRALPGRGWQSDYTTEATQKALMKAGEIEPGEVGAMFRKGSQLLTVQAYRAEDGRGSRVSLFVSPD